MTDLLHAIGSRNSFTQTDHALQLPDRDTIRISSGSTSIITSQLTILLYQDLRSCRREFRVERPGISDIPLKRVCREFRVDSCVLISMHIDDMLRYSEIDRLVAFVQDDEEEVETRHDRCTHGYVGSQADLAVIATSDGVGRCEDRSTGVEGCLNTSFGDRDGLLFHSFVNGDLVGNVHLVEFVNGADSIVRKHERSRFDGEFTSLLVFDNSGCKTRSRRSLARGVDCSW